MSITFEPSNLLEIALKKAVEDPACRPRFFRELLDSKVLIVPAGKKPRIVRGSIPEGTTITFSPLNLDGRAAVPFFTSQQRVPLGAEFIEMSAKVLFKMTRGTCLVMNPGLDYGKVFVPEEVKRLLDGSLFQPQERYVAREAEQVVIGEPSDYPSELVSALARLYCSLSQVNRAWVAFYHNSTRDKEGGLLVGLDVDAHQFDKISGESGVVIDSIPKRHKFVDFVRYNGQGVSAYFSSQKPFYQRRL